MTPDHETPAGAVRRTLENGIGTLILDNPAARNAMSAPLQADLIEGLKVLGADPECRVIVIAGAGGHFCAGGDVKGMTTLDGNNAYDKLLKMQEMPIPLELSFNKQVIISCDLNSHQSSDV